jgi:hypothetical protein
MLQFVDNYLEPITLAEGATAASLSLPDGEYLLTLADSQSAATRWEIIGAVVTSGEAVLTRGQQGTTDQAWPAGSVIYCALTADTLTDMLTWLTELDGAVGAHEAAPDPHPQYTTAAEAAAAAPVQSVQGRQGAVVITASDLSLENVDNTADADKPLSDAATAALALKLDTALKGASNGLAELDNNGKVPLSQINDAVLGQLSYQGLWDAGTNTPALPGAPTSQGDYYVTSAPGTQFGLTFATGDWLVANGAAWGKVDNTDAVSTVQGRTGNVVITKADLDIEETYTLAEKNKLAGVATGATANATNAELRDRTTHTGTQPATTVTVADSGGYFVGETVEAALQEVGALIGDIGAALDAINGEVI